ncbi:MAG TPA: Uma2 family endonuclease [Abditibacteriaceae bacterium]|nr:Uma2 family endonuclease [Abditibacteriaceae bacterium]
MTTAQLEKTQRKIQQEPRPMRWTKEQYHAMADMGWFEGKRVELLQGEIFEKYPDEPPYEPRPMRWTKEQYYHMADMGWFDDKRVELIEGEIIEMSPVGSTHWACVELTVQALRAIFGPGYVVSAQNAFDAGEGAEPQPDIIVIPGSPRDYKDRLPSVALLVVEVADTTLVSDRTQKAALYAKAGIPEYWIVNLLRRRLEVHRAPAAQPHKFGFGYNDVTTHSAADTVAPLAAPQSSIAVADLLP